MDRFVVALVMAAASLLPAFAAERPKLQVGADAPDFLGRDVDGKRVLLSSYRNKVVIVSFFASWCEPCRKELPILERLQRAGASKGLQVIAIDLKEDPQVFHRLVKQNPDYQLRFVSDFPGGVASTYGVKAIPYMFLIGKEGKIAFVNLGYGESIVDRLIPEVNAALNASSETLAVMPPGP